MSASPRAAATTRRAVLGGAAVAVAGALQACGSHAHRPTATIAAPGSISPDVAVLNQLLELEYKTIAAYTAGTPLLDGSAHDAAKQFLTQELYHASKLYSMIKHAGGEPRKQKASYPLGRPSSHDEVLALLQRLERTQIDGYLAAVPTVSTGSTRAVLAAILADDAQHDVVLRAQLGLEPLTSAFVVSTQPKSAR